MNKIRSYFAKIYFPLGWTILVLVLLAMPGSMIPKEQAFAIPGFDKVVHVVLFGGFVWLWSLHVASKRFPIAKRLRFFFYFFILAAIYGIGMEYVQKYWIPGRDYDLGDMIADLIGAGLAYGICNITLVEF
jgi:VanZ like family